MGTESKGLCSNHGQIGYSRHTKDPFTSCKTRKVKNYFLLEKELLTLSTNMLTLRWRFLQLTLAYAFPLVCKPSATDQKDHAGDMSGYFHSAILAKVKLVFGPYVPVNQGHGLMAD